MSKYNDTVIHRIELLLTLDYLLNYTDADHPATQQDICRHARNFGLKYEGGKPGDDVKRQRIGDCLQWLQSLSNKFKNTDKIPFIINSTESGKFYIEEKNHLKKEEIIKILAAIENDKYTKEDDANSLINKLLDVLTNKRNREFYLNELENENKKVRKYTDSTNRNIKLISKAFKENKCILITRSYFGKVTDENKNNASFISNNEDNPNVRFGYIKEDIFCRVYKIEEFDNKPYALLIPINQRGIVFEPISHLNIPRLPLRELLIEDETDDNRLDELFKDNNRLLSSRYESLETYLDEQIMPEGGPAFKTSFYFLYRYFKEVKRSFEEYFAKELPVIKCNSFKVNTSQINRGKALELPHEVDKYAIECEKCNDDEKHPKYGVVNITINRNAFISWLFHNPNIIDIVRVISPNSINYFLAHRYEALAMKHLDLYEKTRIEK